MRAAGELGASTLGEEPSSEAAANGAETNGSNVSSGNSASSRFSKYRLTQAVAPLPMRPAWFAGLLGTVLLCPRPAGSIRGASPIGAGGLASSIPLSPRTADLAIRSAELAMGGDYAGAFIAAAQGLREAPTDSVLLCSLSR